MCVRVRVCLNYFAGLNLRVAYVCMHIILCL